MDTKGFIQPENFRKRERVALISVIAAATIAIAKFITAYLTNSLAMYAESGHSAVDGLAVIVSFIAIRQASRLPDWDHPYGHAKFESVAALLEIMLLISFGVMIVYHAIQRFGEGYARVEIGWLAFAVMFVSIIVEGWRALAMRRAARRTGSEALAASSLHFLTDFLDSIVVIIGLGLTAAGYPIADIFAALFVAGVITVLAYRLSKQVLSSLTDKAPPGVTGEVEQIVLAIDGVIGVHDIRIRRAGSQMFTEMHVDMDSRLSLTRVHDILDDIEHSMHEVYPTMHLATHPEPIDQNNY